MAATKTYPFLLKMTEKAPLIKGLQGSVPRALKVPYPLDFCTSMITLSIQDAPLGSQPHFWFYLALSTERQLNFPIQFGMTFMIGFQKFNAEYQTEYQIKANV